MSINHTKVATAPDDSDYEISSSEWNDIHTGTNIHDHSDANSGGRIGLGVTYTGSGSTTNGSPENIFEGGTDFPTPEADVPYQVELNVIAMRTGGTSGAAGDAGHFKIVFGYVGGLATFIGGAVEELVNLCDQSWAVDPQPTLDGFAIEVTGAVDNDIDWFIEAIIRSP